MATIRRLAEKALASYLKDHVTGATVEAGTSTDVKEAPVVVCAAVEWAEDEMNLNWYRVRCTVATHVMQADGPDAFDALCGQVRDALRLTDLGPELTAAQTGIAFAFGAISAPDKGAFTITDDLWVETRELELYCALTT